VAVGAAVALSLLYRAEGSEPTPILLALVAFCGLFIYTAGALIPGLAASCVPPWILLRQGDTNARGPGRSPGGAAKQRVRLGAGILGLALDSLLGRLRRHLLTIVAMTAGGGMVAAFLAVTFGLRGTLYGTLLGEYLVVQVGPLHYLLAGVCLIVAGLTCAEVTGLNLVERQGELTLLCSCGWRPGSVIWLVVAEAGALGLIAGVLGYAAALLALGQVYPEIARLTLWCLPSVLVPPVVSLGAAFIPAWAAVRRSG